MADSPLIRKLAVRDKLSANERRRLEGLVSATEQPKTRLCMACFDGQYPIELPAGNLIGKHVLEGVGRRAAVPETPSGEGKSLVGSPGGADALHRP